MAWREVPTPSPEDRNETIRRLIATHGDFARRVAARQLRRRDGRHVSLTPDDLGLDVMLEAAGFDHAGRLRGTDTPETDHRTLRARIARRCGWRLDDREKLPRVKARRRAIDVHDAVFLVDESVADPADLVEAGMDELVSMARGMQAAAGGSHAEDVSPCSQPTAADGRAESARSAELAERPSIDGLLDLYARTVAASDPVAARRLMLFDSVRRRGIKQSVASRGLSLGRAQSYRDLEEMDRWVAGMLGGTAGSTKQE